MKNAQILDGKKVADEIIDQLKQAVQELPKPPSFAIVICGRNQASLLYTSMKQKKSTQIGIAATVHQFSEEIEDNELIAQIQKIQKTVDGIMVQLPLPAHLDTNKIVSNFLS